MKTKIDWTNPPQAEEHALVRDIEAQMGGAQIRDATTVCGHTYELETLWPHEESWADGYVKGVNFYQTGRNRRLPYLAASLRAVDGVSVEQLFKLPASTPVEIKAEFDADPTLVVAWRREQILARLGGERPWLQPPVVAELWQFYQALEERRTGVLEKIGPLSTRADVGASSPTSSPAKAS